MQKLIFGQGRETVAKKVTQKVASPGIRWTIFGVNFHNKCIQKHLNFNAQVHDDKV